MTLNPIYESAPFELDYIFSPQVEEHQKPTPLRFHQEDVSAVLAYMQKGEMDKVVALSIPKWIPDPKESSFCSGQP